MEPLCGDHQTSRTVSVRYQTIRLVLWLLVVAVLAFLSEGRAARMSLTLLALLCLLWSQVLTGLVVWKPSERNEPRTSNYGARPSWAAGSSTPSVKRVSMPTPGLTRMSLCGRFLWKAPLPPPGELIAKLWQVNWVRQRRPYRPVPER